eukprot:TRINITY_DN68199_c5_g3_i1.p1 TRINITY_DN68199_c5_g3~~TRINITY_DN68199_c5_g3_i1.p1  ORF type:complete len:619 (-),score=21.17 TRINITY_DN68199_c5_g3_i1:143-1975(-)
MEEQIEQVLEDLDMMKYAPAFKRAGLYNVHDCKTLTDSQWVKVIPDVNDRSYLVHAVRSLLLGIEPPNEKTPLNRVTFSCDDLDKLEKRGSPKMKKPTFGSFESFASSASSHLARSHPKLDEAEWDNASEVVSNIPSRLERLPWSRWHTQVCFSLALGWFLDGLLVSTLAMVGPQLVTYEIFYISPWQTGLIGTAYILGCVVGSCLFGFLADTNGRKRPLIMIPLVYSVSSFLVIFAWSETVFLLCVFAAGVGIGGEYSTALCAVNEIIPARVRGSGNMMLNGGYWCGYLSGAVICLAFFSTAFPAEVGWRLPFAIIALGGLAIAAVRCYLPESPRWLVLHGYEDRAEEIMGNIEAIVAKDTAAAAGGGSIPSSPFLDSDASDVPTTNIKVGYKSSPKMLIMHMIGTYRDRSILALSLMISQAFLVNSIVFTSGMILKHFYHVPSHKLGYYEGLFSVVPLVGCVLISFVYDRMGIFVFAAVSSSSAYLTISEVFPLEIRATSTAVFYSIGTLIGGSLTPLIFDSLVEQTSRLGLVGGYFVTAGMVIAAGCVEFIWGPDAEHKSLEAIAVDAEFVPYVDNVPQLPWRQVEDAFSAQKVSPKSPDAVHSEAV